MRLDPGPDTGAQLVRQVSGYLELAPAAGFVLAPGDALEITDLSVDHTPHHANDGPASAFVVLDDGSTIDVARRTDDGLLNRARCRTREQRRSRARRPMERPALVPWPAAVDRIVRAARRHIGAGAIGGAAAVGIERGR